VITAHGDFNPSNVVISKDTGKYLAIDLEYCTVQYAAGSLAYVLRFFGNGTLEAKRLFCKEYLEACDLSSDPAEVDLLIFDAECARLRYFFGAILTDEIILFSEQTTIKHNSSWDGYDFVRYKAYADFEDRARKDEKLRAEVVKDGFEAVAGKDEVVKAGLKEYQVWLDRPTVKRSPEEIAIIEKKFQGELELKI
jgi:hypothetical protein